MRIPLAPAGRREMVVITLLFGGLAVAGYVAAASGHAWGAPAGILFTLVWAFGLAFFRDPERHPPNEPDILVAPADGKVVETVDLDYHPELNGPAKRIGIFLSIFNVHINRSPCTGVVRKIQYQPGRFLDARDPDSGPQNEANLIVIEPDNPDAGPVVVRQIAGKIARRIVCSLKVGDPVETGQRIGLIKFGSRTELIVTADSQYVPAVKIGDRTCGAATVMARRNAKNNPQPIATED